MHRHHDRKKTKATKSIHKISSKELGHLPARIPLNLFLSWFPGSFALLNCRRTASSRLFMSCKLKIMIITIHYICTLSINCWNQNTIMEHSSILKFHIESGWYGFQARHFYTVFAVVIFRGLSRNHFIDMLTYICGFNVACSRLKHTKTWCAFSKPIRWTC